MHNFTKAMIIGAAAVAVPAHADGGLTFVINGDTFSNPFTITNTSTGGETVTAFGIGLIAPFGFDTVNGGFGIDAAVAFAPAPGAVALTGYTGPAAFADGSSSINFTFSNFNVGESFIWDIDVDQDNIATVFGNQLIGSTGYADFSNGLRGNGTFVAFGQQGAQFVINTFTPTPQGVPEPGTWAMMIFGFGIVGNALRRRRQTVKLTFA